MSGPTRRWLPGMRVVVATTRVASGDLLERDVVVKGAVGVVPSIVARRRVVRRDDRIVLAVRLGHPEPTAWRVDPTPRGGGVVPVLLDVRREPAPRVLEFVSTANTSSIGRAIEMVLTTSNPTPARPTWRTPRRASRG